MLLGLSEKISGILYIRMSIRWDYGDVQDTTGPYICLFEGHGATSEECTLNRDMSTYCQVCSDEEQPFLPICMTIVNQ